MPRGKDAPVAPDDRRRLDIFRAADAIRADRKERVSLRSIRAWMKRHGLVPGNNQCVGEYLALWTAETGYSPVIELSGMPEAVATQLGRAGAQLWEAAQAEAAAVHGSHRRRMDEAIAAERELRNEALALLDAREETIEAQRRELAWYAGEIDRMKGYVRDVRARDFWGRVADEI